MNYKNHNNIVAAISIFTQQKAQILGKPFLFTEEQEEEEEEAGG